MLLIIYNNDIYKYNIIIYNINFNKLKNNVKFNLYL